MKKKSLLHGAMWGTIAVFLSKLMGFLYLIPLVRVLSIEQLNVFQYSYRIYGYIILIATAGIPFATAIMISKYNAKHNYSVGLKLLKSNVLVMLIVGFLSFLFLSLLAPIIVSNAYPLDPDATEGYEERISGLIAGVRTIAFALIFVPVVSVVRGFFQGFKEIQISATSQLVEQFINAVFIIIALLLAGTGFISTDWALKIAIFCSTIASVASLAYLLLKYKQTKRIYYAYYKVGNKYKTNIDIPILNIYKELLLISAPYILIVLLGQSMDIIDLQKTNPALIAHGFSATETARFSAIYGSVVLKLMTIPMTISIGLSVALVPHLSEARALKDVETIKNTINNILTGSTVVIIAIVLIMMATSYEIFFLISSKQNAAQGSIIFMYFGIVAILNTFAIILQNMLLSLSLSRHAFVYTLISALVKLALTSFLTIKLGVLGLALSSVISLFVLIIPATILFRKLYQVNYTNFFRTIFYSFGIGSLMFIVINQISTSINTTKYVTVMFETGILFAIGLGFYFSAALYFDLIPKNIKDTIINKFRGLR